MAAVPPIRAIALPNNQPTDKNAAENERWFTRSNVLPQGRPTRRTQAWRYEMSLIFQEDTVVSKDDMRDMIRAAVVQAKEGNADARAWVSAYVFGKPPRVDETEAFEGFNVEGNLNIAVLNADQIRSLQSIIAAASEAPE